MLPEWLRDKQFVFIIGAPRSGTTWLYKVILSHPDTVALGNEVSLFNNYIAPLSNNFDKELEHNKLKNIKYGLPHVWNKGQFDEFIFSFIENFYSSLKEKPDSKLILEKNPLNSRYVDLIHYYIPNAKFIHIIRDGRDVAFSWNKIFFWNADFAAACKNWVDAKNAAKKAKQFTGNYYELHYEDLVLHPITQLSAIFKFCNINASEELINSIVAETTGEKSMVSNPDSNTSYSDRVSKTPLWKKRLSKMQIHIATKILGKDLIEEGYEKDTKWGLGPIENKFYSIRISAIEFSSKVKRNIKTFIKSLLYKTA